MSVATLCEELANAGMAIEVFTTTANGTQELPVVPDTALMVDGVQVTYFKRITKDHTHFSPALLKALWTQVRTYDAIHVHAWWNLVSVLSAAIAVARNVPVIVSPRGMLSPYTFNNKHIGAKSIIHRVFGKHLLQKSHIHTTSAHESRAVTQLVQPLGITAIPNFVKLAATTITAKPPRGQVLNLLFFSRIEEKKGLNILIDALRLLTVPFHLTIAGSGEDGYVKSLKEQAVGLENRITWAGFYGKDKFALLQQHDVMVLASHDENFGNVVIESLSVGTAVLISEHVGLADYVRDNGFGWICQTNAVSVADAITAISLDDKGVLEKTKDIAPAIIRHDFTGYALTQKYINLYRQIINA
ncbi:glycosyltransferase [Mucilaginibacter psychrotolerans]|uniref:Glycosyltransferase n=2 Tax=Mucilaginibacter psychrotolerans TaxID=1524096 RepID=A0A4Y8SQT4_9SPHI|nr:glycosyltransferase [Mucilaginibacter psychrotolerans]